MKGMRVGKRNVPGLLNDPKNQSEVESHEFIEAAICFIVILSPGHLCYLGTGKNKTDSWVYPGMGFCQRDVTKGKGKENYN